jgi:hypothetical protein
MIARREIAANSGVPAKIEFHAVIRACLASLFLMRTCFNCDRCSTKTRPLQMIDLVLQAHRQQTHCFDNLFVSFQIEVANDDTFRSLDLVVNSGHRQAPFLTDL